MAKKFFSMAMLAMLATSFVACDKNDDDNDNVNTDVVDLGLPSGIKWATCNVGATNPWNYGNYYAWGETETESDYSWDNYKYCNGSGKKLNKYCSDANFGYDSFTDDLTTLESSDDVATAVFGADYSMPTTTDWDELSSQCYWVWITNYNEHNVSGYIVYGAKSDGDKGVKVYSSGTLSPSYSLSDAHIFLPAAHCRGNSDLHSAGNEGYYWSSLLDESYPNCARYCEFGRNYVGRTSDYYRRCFGCSVRPVKRP